MECRCRHKRVRDPEEMNARRRQAAEWFAEGVSGAEVARRLHVTPASTCRWRQAWKEKGELGLHSRKLGGPDPRLSPAERAQLEEALAQGPVAAGYQTDRWTLTRIRALIRKLFGVSYQKSRLAEILQEMKWSWQKPGTRAKERKDDEITRWRQEEWPRIREEARRQGAQIALLDEAGFSERPSVRGTWAKRGRPPTLRARFNWKRIATTGILVYVEVSGRVRLLTQKVQGSIRSERVIAALRHLRRHTRGKVILLWDGLSAHTSKVTREYISRQRDWLQVERLPAYAPDLNPVEMIWGNLRERELANFAPDTLQQLWKMLVRGINRLRRSPALMRSFLNHVGLFPELALAARPP